MEIFVELLALLLLTRTFGEGAERLGQPSSSGEILAGVLLALCVVWLGPTLPFLSRVATSEVLEIVANVGIFLLVLSAGIEMEPREIAASSKKAIAVALGGMAIPLAGGFALVWAFLPESDQRFLLAFLAGVAMSISAIPATAKILTDLDLIHTQIGELILSAALFDDIFGLFLLAVLLAMIDTGNAPDLVSMLLLLGKVALFFLITIVLGVHVYPQISRGMKTMEAAATEFSALAIVALAYGLLAELLGMHWILGAFMAGLYFERSRVGFRAYQEIRLICATLSSGVLGPLFFAYIGLHVDLQAVTEVPLFLMLVIAVALFGKLLGSGLPARLSGLPMRDAATVGAGLSARGAVELVVLSIAYERGVFPTSEKADGIAGHLFSALVIMGVVTTMLAPALLRWINGRKE